MPKQKYIKPIIIRHASAGMANKFGRPLTAIPTQRIEGIQIQELAANYGSPLFVLSVRELRQRYRELHRAFANRYPNFQIAYSYKTNYLKSVCSILHQEGAWAEVVSGFEYDIARDLGMPGNQIIFNGPYKKRDELKRAFIDGAIVNIDNYDELNVIESLADELGKTLEIGVRLNMNLNNPPWYKFGFNVESGQAYDVVRRAQSSGKVKVVGLHIHAGTYIDDLTIYQKAAAGILQFYQSIRNQLGVTLKYWDLGGGFASRNTLHWAYLPGEQTCPSYSQYADAISSTLMSIGLPPNEMPRLFIEPGRALVDEPFSLITKVVAEKRLPSGQRAVILDAGMNILSSVQWYKYGIQTVQDSGTMVEDTVLYGGLCMNIDVLNANVSLPQVRFGEYLLIPHVGAYNLSQSWQFIFLKPAVIAIEDGEVKVIKRAETREIVQAAEELPDDFRF